MSNTIYFYRTRDPYGCFSNFSRHAIVFNSKVWPTSEHYFQAQKFAGTEHEELVRLCNTPRKAADMGRDRNRPLRPDWESVKEDIMWDALWSKFCQHEDIRNILMSTGDSQLVEDSKVDSYWGCGADKQGKNRLGVLLMKLREELRG